MNSSLSLFVTIFVCAMMTLNSAELASKACHFLLIDLRKPNGNCEKPVSINDTSLQNTTFGVWGTHPLKCPKRINISWLQSPPFVHKTNEEDAQPSGIFVDLLHSSLSACCRLEGSDPPHISYDTRPVTNLESLHMKMHSQATDIFLPLNYVPGQYAVTGYEIFDVLTSPGDALLVNKSLQYNQDQNEAWQSLIKVLPILLLSILLSAIAGICVWTLDTKWNPKDFPRPFTQGASEGFWWAFVTMTTVGYGDRTPKSFFARMFGIFWMVVSLTVCSIMTASVTAVLTSINVDKDYDIGDKDLAVLKDSPSITNAVKNDANPKLFEDFDSMYNALKEGHVDGILMEMYEASYAIQEKGDDNLKLAKLYRSPTQFSFAVLANPYSNPLPSEVQNCLRMIFKFRQNDVFLKVNEFSKEAKKKSRSKKFNKHDFMSLVSFDSPGLIIISGCFLLLCICGAVDQIYRAKRYTEKKSQDIGLEESKNMDSESLGIQNGHDKPEDHGHLVLQKKKSKILPVIYLQTT